MGIKSKIRLGFISIGVLLFISGLISSLELVKFNRQTHIVLARNQSGAEFSKQMLDAVQEQNTALLLSLTEPEQRPVYDSLIVKSGKDLDRALQGAHRAIRRPEELERVREAVRYYYSVIGQLDDSTDIHWFTQVYKTPYYNLTQAVKSFMVETQTRTIDYTDQLERNAYRASMVGIIALAGGISILFVFYFMLRSYFITPVLQITKSLKGYMDTRVPFAVKVSTRDEINTLKDYITSLVETNRKSKS